MKKSWIIFTLLFSSSAFASCIETENSYITTVSIKDTYKVTTQKNGRILDVEKEAGNPKSKISEEKVIEGNADSEECIYDSKSQTLILNYAINKDRLTPAHQQVLQQYLEILDKSLSIVVDGHADKTGSPKYNLALSKRRASNAASYLRDTLGQGKRIIERGFGESSPVCSSTENGKSGCNRRVVLTVEASEGINKK
ncbi:OmpA family protein [Vibrio sp. JC009]|uniref:OmpA family protein n=1 Tax=Vibrio sp. JC009 TaxID=2912314 RepID=UPI0023AEA7E0|nr:OmpA family protein [Vibrio sp. JC009]WED24576.1 OmpA family protein [Vibrio sp. JC009]